VSAAAAAACYSVEAWEARRSPAKETGEVLSLQSIQKLLDNNLQNTSAREK